MTRALIPWRALLAAAVLSVLVGAALSQGLIAREHSSLQTARAAASSHRGLSSLPLAAQGPVSAALGADRPVYRLSAAGGAFRALNPAQRLSARFDRSGVAFGTGELRVTLSLRAVGYGSSLGAVGGVAPSAQANRVGYAHAGLSEWYLNGPLGLEQGFTIARAPAARRSGPLTLSIALSGNARALLSGDARSVLFSHGASSLRYGGLIATDAAGGKLHSSLALDRGRLLIHVDTRGARYPLRIDPLIQQGGKLTGKEEEGGGGFGESVALSADGNTALIGGPGDEVKGEMLVGAAWVFTRSGSTWTQQGPKLRGGGREGEGQFGISVALSSDGNTALIGGINDMSKGETLGAAWVFTRSGSTWTQQGLKLTGGGEETLNGRFGKSVALSSDGNTALIGGYFDNGQKGAAWVFTRSGSTWKQQGTKLVGGGETGNGEFGNSVALSSDGNTALIGALGDEGSEKALHTGAVWVFTRSGSTWTQQGSKLIGSERAGVGELGASVALSADGNTALAGGPGDGGAGSAWAFTRSGSNWSQQGPKLAPSDAAGPADFGSGVALSADGRTAVIGAHLDMGAAVPTGAAWEFARAGSTWSQQGAKLQGAGVVTESEFGAAVALSADGRTALIGGPINSEDGVPDAGAAWVFVNPVVTPPILPVPSPGTGTASSPSPPAVTRPVISNLTQSHSHWRAGNALARLSAKTKKRKAPLGTTISFRLNVAATVTFTFTQRLAGRRVNGDCVAQRVKNRRKPSCKRTIVPGIQALRAHAGSNRLAFQGALPRGKKLKPGPYTLLIVAASGRLRSTAKTLSFTIVK